MNTNRFGATLNALEKRFWKDGFKQDPIPKDNLAALAKAAKAAVTVVR